MSNETQWEVTVSNRDGKRTEEYVFLAIDAAGAVGKAVGRWQVTNPGDPVASLWVALYDPDLRIDPSVWAEIRSVLQERLGRYVSIDPSRLPFGLLEPHERETLWVRIGVDRGMVRSDEEMEVALEMDVNRIRQIEASALRKLKIAVDRAMDGS